MNQLSFDFGTASVAANDPAFSTRLYRRASESRYQCVRWQRTRRIALERDGYACHHCGKRMPAAIRLDVDHVIPVAIRPDLFYTLSNLQTLCSDCHQVKTWLDAQRYGWTYGAR